MEIWRNIKGKNCTYWISSLGDIKRSDSKPILINERRKRRYVSVQTEFNQYLYIGLARIVAVAFLGHSFDDPDIVVDHIDGNSLNDHVENLQVITRGQNISKYFLGTDFDPIKKGIAPLSADNYFVSDESLCG